MEMEKRCAFIREWVPSLQAGRSSRPGFDLDCETVTDGVLRDWIVAVKGIGVRSIICLLSEAEMEWWYSHLPRGLVGAYQAARIEAVSIPVPLDIPGVLTQKQMKDLEEAFARLPRPTLIHCSAGQVRSGAALRHLVEHIIVRGHQVDAATDAEISRLIRNAAFRHGACSPPNSGAWDGRLRTPCVAARAGWHGSVGGLSGRD